MSGYSEVAHREAADRLIRFARRPDVVAVIDRLKPWSESDHGTAQWRKLVLLADFLLSGDMHMGEYQAHLQVMAMANRMPLSEFKIVAIWALEFTRCTFFGHGHDLIVDVHEDVEAGGK